MNRTQLDKLGLLISYHLMSFVLFFSQLILGLVLSISSFFSRLSYARNATHETRKSMTKRKRTTVVVEQRKRIQQGEK